MRYFPLYFDFQNRSIAIIGGGDMASAKLRLFARSPAIFYVIARDLNADMRSYVDAGRVIWKNRHFRHSDLRGMSLVIAATGDDAADRKIAALARRRGILAAAVDQAEASDFLTPALIDRSPITIAIGSEGTAPVLTRKIKAQIEQLLPLDVAIMAKKAAALRPILAEKLQENRLRRLFWEKLFDSPHWRSLLVQKRPTDAFPIDDVLQQNINDGWLAFFALGTEDTESLSVKARRYFYEADMIFYDQGINEETLELARREASFEIVRSPAMKKSSFQKKIAGALKKNMKILRLINQNFIPENHPELCFAEHNGIDVAFPQKPYHSFRAKPSKAA